MEEECTSKASGTAWMFGRSFSPWATMYTLGRLYVVWWKLSSAYARSQWGSNAAIPWVQAIAPLKNLRIDNLSLFHLRHIQCFSYAQPILSLFNQLFYPLCHSYPSNSLITTLPSSSLCGYLFNFLELLDHLASPRNTNE